MKSQMKQTTLFQHLKEFINNKWAWTDDAQFTTKQMREKIGKFENRTWWKEVNKNPHYVLHTYLGHLRELGCITRVSHGKYKINRGIPEWFGSFHFNGLKGNLEHYNNLYWNSLPAKHKVNPWAEFVEPKQIRIEEALGGWPEWEPNVKSKYPANVEGSIEFRIAAMQERLAEQTKQLQNIKDALLSLQAEADRQNTPQQIGHTHTQTDAWEVSYLGKNYSVQRRIDNHDWSSYPNSWSVKDLGGEYADNDIAEYLIKWVIEHN